ncbi:SulP family inorganic anion transporter [Panacibacter ginsenosidivorans]|uniref:SulP family inorganic anion transporter n=1 Tax=Panacibacter ginsenosidivorans TaxID=1813871 RepID=A0A5B8V9C4_9BACT|nr:SulP family inorganic anion transporter [Panacibacter ginsenosidivorans]QEC68120.1 SulP family inorganic anion transporter [Panacibacter ginsenosidivorans]
MKNMFKNAGADLSASVVVFLVALPLCLGIALGSGAPLFSGIIAGVVGGIIVGSLSGSHLSVSGPAAGLTAIVAAAILKMPAYETFLLAVVLAGVIQIILGFIKAGVFGDYVPSSVIKGMLSAIGIILILKQLPHFLGYDADFQGDYEFVQKDSKNTFSEIIMAAQRITPVALIIGAISLAIQIVWDKVLVKKGKFFQLIPAPLVVVVASIFIYQFAAGNGNVLKPEQMVNLPVASNATEFFTFFTMPDWSGFSNPLVWTTALTLAIVASLETLLNIEAADNLDPYQRVTPTNRELKAQGIGNIVSGLLGGLPVTSVVVRTSANVNAGAKTKMSAVAHGILLLLSVALIPGLLKMIPLSALAAILIYTGYKLAKPSIFRSFYHKGFDQFVPFVITILAIIFTDLLIGILIGIVVGLFFVLRSNFKTALFVVNDNNKYLFRLRKDVSFLNKPILKAKLEEVPANAYVLIDLSRTDFLDKDVIEVINDFQHHAHLKNIRVEIRKSLYKKDHQLIEEKLQLVTV